MARLTDPTPSAGSIRPLNSGDQAGGLRLSTAACWNQNPADWQLLVQTCLGRGLEMPGAGLIGTAMAWPLAGRYAWINMVLVLPEFRGRGIARSLMEALLDDLSQQGRIAFLDATEMGESLYRKLGFRDGPRLLRLRRAAEKSPVSTEVAGLRAMTPADLNAVGALDEAVFGLDRRQLLENFLARCPSLAWVHESAGAITGFVTARDGRNATQLGPVVAVDRAVAGRLLRRAMAEVAGPVILDVPAGDDVWLKEVNALGFEVLRGFMRMTRHGEELATDWARYFAISGPDFA
ncbi:MAG: GNAT family N-acetyltransferase [Cephaloticoccus sp.]